MKLKAKIASSGFDFKTGKPLVTFEFDGGKNALVELDDIGEELTIEIKKYHPKRSLDANALAWVFIDKLAEKMNLPKVEVYRNCIKEIGGVSDTVCVPNKAVDKLCEAWRKNGLGWSCETFESKLPNCTNVILYYGSSTFDTATMTRFIDNLLQDCKAVGIDTTPLSEANLLGIDRR
ncbi:MAG: hypothetical protein IKU30_01040 [Clostridia bacterium]|nr:hypothetical protein [Clostridia bacterium]